MRLITRLTRWMLKHRFLKFGTVGASGTAVNLSVLYLAQEFLFSAVQPLPMRLNASLALAILCATANNFFWNRLWTWRDRQHRQHKSLLTQFGQYAMACWVGIALQVVFTKLFVAYFYYLFANALAIALASVFNFLVNDRWTFRHAKTQGKTE